MSKTQTRRTVSMTRALYEELKLRAAAENLPLTEIVSNALHQFWKRSPVATEKESAVHLAKQSLHHDGLPEHKQLTAQQGDFLVNVDFVVQAKTEADARRIAKQLCLAQQVSHRAKDFLVLSIDSV